MRFSIEQRFGADSDPDRVARAYTDPDLYAALDERGRLGRPEVLDRREDGDLVLLRLRYRFTGELSSAARAVLDPDRLSWVEESEHQLAARRVSFRMVPDHYGDRFRAAGEVRIVASDEGGACRVVDGDLRVRALVVGPAVERAIVSGLREHLRDEVPVVQEFLRTRA